METGATHPAAVPTDCTCPFDIDLQSATFLVYIYNPSAAQRGCIFNTLALLFVIVFLLVFSASDSWALTFHFSPWLQANRQASGALLKQTEGPVVRQGWRHAITNRRLLVVVGTWCTGPRLWRQVPFWFPWQSNSNIKRGLKAAVAPDHLVRTFDTREMESWGLTLKSWKSCPARHVLNKWRAERDTNSGCAALDWRASANGLSQDIDKDAVKPSLSLTDSSFLWYTFKIKMSFSFLTTSYVGCKSRDGGRQCPL